ncbi:MAG TPA: heparinase II/III family protein [Longimicrobiaceae bacterium]|nr:heparinase II/III family protein [Longimicrobiaceae bacterium]
MAPETRDRPAPATASPGSGLPALVLRARALPRRALVPRALRYVRRRIVTAVERRRDLGARTYLAADPAASGPLLTYFAAPDAEALLPHGEQLAALAAHYLDHRFDLLGSGWVQVRRGTVCRGVAGHRYGPGPAVAPDAEGRWLAGLLPAGNLREGQRIWSLVDPGYEPIDWQLDFRSGYRWSERTWSADVPYGHLPGVDVKVPWELARMQHLPQLALAFALAGEGGAARHGFRPPEEYAREFRNQVLDFAATNPPRFGVHWRSSMDVGIRAANLLAARDLFIAAGARFDDAFEAVFRRSLLEHGRHVVRHFGWSDQPRANHYLSHVVGLLWVAAYLPRTPETDAWLAFAAQELVVEVERQFHPDGSNFEGSTGYHRLVGEMVVYSTTLVLGLPAEKRRALAEYDHRLVRTRPRVRPAPLPLHATDGGDPTPFPAAYLERLERMAEFTLHVTKAGGRVAQVGDNDSGRFFRLLPAHARMTVREARERYAHLEGYAELPDEAAYWDEQPLDHRHFVSAANGLLGRTDLAAFAGPGVEQRVVAGLARGARIPSSGSGRTRAESVRVPEHDAPLPAGAPLRHETRLRFDGPDLRTGLRLLAYPDFGLYLFRSDRLFLAVRCGSIGQEGNGGHAHNDQLSVELAVDGRDVLADPGSFLYTALPELRNRYRSDRAHHAFRSRSRESAGLGAGLFTLGGDPRARCLRFDEAGFVGMHTGFGFPVVRRVEVHADSVRVEDRVYAAPGTDVLPFYLWTGEGDVPFSPGYGKVLREP